ncbi:hypothetical protein K250101E9_05300 [Enterocloster aldenensis]
MVISMMLDSIFARIVFMAYITSPYNKYMMYLYNRHIPENPNISKGGFLFLLPFEAICAIV